MYSKCVGYRTEQNQITVNLKSALVSFSLHYDAEALLPDLHFASDEAVDYCCILFSCGGAFLWLKRTTTLSRLERVFQTGVQKGGLICI